MTQAQAMSYLEDYLRDEFRGCPEVRVRSTPVVVAARAPDLEQDVDESALPSQGVYLRVVSREHFFPVEWVMEGRFDQVQAQAREIRQKIG